MNHSQNPRATCRASLALALLLSGVAVGSSAQLPAVSVDDLYTDGLFNAQGPAPMTPFADGTTYYAIGEGGTTVEQREWASGKTVTTLCDLANVKGECPLKRIEDCQANATGEYLLLEGPRSGIYRYSYRADHYIYDIRHRTLTPLSEGGGEQQPLFSPNGAMVAYVKEGNLNIFKLKYMSRSAVTTDGAAGQVINGLPDWVCEEEFSLTRAFEWSPDSRLLAFVRYDESRVPTFELPIFRASNPTCEEAALYPQKRAYKYPKAGEANAEQSLRVYDVEGRTTKTIDLGREECYLTRLLWTGAQDQLAVVKVNRLQNRLQIVRVNAKSTVATPIYEETNKRYITAPELTNLLFIDEGQRFIVLAEQDGWAHLHLYDSNGNKLRQLTQGDYDDTYLYGYNAATQTLYYQAARHSPTRREIYALNFKKFKETVVCDEPGMNTADFTPDCSYYVLGHSSSGSPDVYTLCDAKGQRLRVVEDNAAVRAAMGKRRLRPREFLTVPGAAGEQLNAWMVKPDGCGPDHSHPALIVQYSGPNVQQVLDQWEVDWEQVLADQGYVVLCVDPRGTGARGEEFRKCTYKQLGHLESDDLIAVAKHLGALPYIDPARVGVWGWSYGGFMSSLCLCRSDVFKAAVAVAPVTSWRFYDTVYTERYMQRPDQNAEGYDQWGPLALATNMSGNYLIVSGTADDNVHNQNQMELVDALVQAGKQFDMFTYPNRNHSLYGGRVRTHLYEMMLRWLRANL